MYGVNFCVRMTGKIREYLLFIEPYTSDRYVGRDGGDDKDSKRNPHITLYR